MTERGRCDAANVTDLTGRRVVVRHRVGDKQTDAVGELCGKFPVYPHRLGNVERDRR